MKGLEREQKNIKVFFLPKHNANKIPSNNKIIDCFNGNHSTYFYKKNLCTVVCHYAMINGGFFSPEFKRSTMSNPMNWWFLLIKEHFIRSVADKRLINVKKINVFLFFCYCFCSYCNWRDYTVIYNDIYVFLGLVCKKKSSIFIQLCRMPQTCVETLSAHTIWGLFFSPFEFSWGLIPLVINVHLR